MRSSQHKIIEVSLPDYEGIVRVLGVTYYPYCRATEIDPPEESWVEYEQVLLEGSDHDVKDLLSGKTVEWLEQRVIDEIEGN